MLHRQEAEGDGWFNIQGRLWWTIHYYKLHTQHYATVGLLTDLLPLSFFQSPFPFSHSFFRPLFQSLPLSAHTFCQLLGTMSKTLREVQSLFLSLWFISYNTHALTSHRCTQPGKSDMVNNAGRVFLQSAPLLCWASAWRSGRVKVAMVTKLKKTNSNVQMCQHHVLPDNPFTLT